jgi:hypothetical protein
MNQGRALAERDDEVRAARRLRGRAVHVEEAEVLDVKRGLVEGDAEPGRSPRARRVEHHAATSGIDPLSSASRPRGIRRSTPAGRAERPLPPGW